MTLDTAPQPAAAHSGADLDRHADRLRSTVADLEARLARLPRRPDRDPAQQHEADELLTAARTARRAFLARHTDAVYDRLTDRRTRYVRLDTLVYTAAEEFPGLVPGRSEMAVESSLIQSERDGREVDQGILCGALLGSARSGTHLIEAMLRPTDEAERHLAEYAATGCVRLSSVDVLRRDHTAHVTFRNGHTLNAEDNQLISDLETAVDLVLQDGETRVGVLRGGPVDHPRHAGRRVFSAGINLKSLRNGKISFVDFLMGRELGYIHKILRGVLVRPEAAAWVDRTVQKPWIGAVDSFAIGGGMQLLLVLDHVIAECGSYVSLPAADEGIVPGLGNLRLTRAVGTRLARQVILSGRRIASDDPEARLVCDDIVSPQDMDAAVARAAKLLAAPAVTANRQMLTLAEEPLDLYRTYLAEFAVAQSARAYSSDVLAKVERRWQAAQSRRTTL